MKNFIRYLKLVVLVLLCFALICDAYYEYSIIYQSKSIAVLNNFYSINICYPDRADVLKPKLIPNYRVTWRCPIGLIRMV